MLYEAAKYDLTWEQADGSTVYRHLDGSEVDFRVGNMDTDYPLGQVKVKISHKNARFVPGTFVPLGQKIMATLTSFSPSRLEYFKGAGSGRRRENF